MTGAGRVNAGARREREPAAMLAPATSSEPAAMLGGGLAARALPQARLPAR